MSSNSCPNCNKSILNQTPYLIGTTKCNNPCPPEGVCDDQIPSNCVFYSGQDLSCSGIQNGDTLTTSLTKIESKLCLVQDKCYEWENVTFDLNGIVPNTGLYPTEDPENWQNVSGVNVKYTKEPIGCRAGLQGVCTNKVLFEQDVPPGANNTRKTLCISKLFSIPLAIRPSVPKNFSVSVKIDVPAEWPGQTQILTVPANVYITPAGEVGVTFNNYSPWVVYPGTDCSCVDGAALEPYFFNADLDPTTPPYLVATLFLDGIYYDL